MIASGVLLILVGLWLLFQTIVGQLPVRLVRVGLR